MALIVDIQKRFGPFQLRAAFEAGDEVTGLLGASGSGKSLTLKCIAGIETPDVGHIELDGRVLFDRGKGINLPPQLRRTGYLFQNFALFPTMTAEKNIAAGFRDRGAAREGTARLIAALRLEDCMGKLPRQLSGGQQQRVALARILASEPAALLLDEPFSALDASLKWEVELELRERLEQFSGPSLFVSHDREEVCRLCGQVCVLDRGASQPVQSLRDLFERPATLSAARLSGCENFSKLRRLEDGRLEAEDWGLVFASGQTAEPDCACVGIRASRLRRREGPGPNCLPCRLKRVVEGQRTVTLLLSTPSNAALRMEWGRDQLPADGFPEQMWVEFPVENLLFLKEQ